MNPARTSLSRSALAAIALLGVLALLLLGTPPAPAWAADGATVAITPATQTKPSGNDFEYDLSYGCSAVGTPAPGEEPNCLDTRITIPLQGLIEAGFDTNEIEQMIELPDDVQWSVASGQLVIVLGEVPAGESGSIPLRITPPNHITPNGTTWEMTPVISGSDFPDATSTVSAVSTATSEAKHLIDKKVNGSGFRSPGDEVEYSIVVGCAQTAAGNILLQSMTVTDVLPEGLSFVSATPAPSSTSDGLTWDLNPLPPSCATQGAEGSTTILLRALVNSPLDASIQEIENRARVNSVTLDDRPVPEANDPAPITIVGADGPSAGKFIKESFAQIRDESATSTKEEDNSHTTYPGQWIPTRQTQPAGVLGGFKPNERTEMLQSGYKMQYHSGTVQGSGAMVGLVDTIPCIVNSADVVHQSNEPGELCQNPAFIVTTVSVWSAVEGIDPLAETYRPVATLSTGATVVLEPAGESARNAQTYVVPESAVGSVAEINFPADPGLSGHYIRWAIFGYASAQTSDLNVLQNTAYATVNWDGKKIADAVDTAELYIIERPQTGIEKTFRSQRGGNATLRLTANLVTPSVASNYDFVVTDLLPAGMTVSEQPTVITAQVTQDGGTAVSSPADSIEAIDNYANSGRTLIRVKWLAANHTDFEGSVGLRTEMDFKVQVREDIPGIYDNTAQVFFNHPNLLSSCQQPQNVVQSNLDPMDLDGNGKIDDRYCWASDELEIDPKSGSASFASTKTVQGDEDSAPQSYPGIASVGTDGGAALFTVGWQNTGATTLRNPVTYDVFPQVGDAGVGGASAGVPRGSEFAASLMSVDAPENVTVYYTLAQNPCRDEVFSNVQNVGCVDDWSATAPADLSTVTGVKLVGNGPFAFGNGYEVRLQMTVPSGIAPGAVAWNSIAANAQRPDSSWMQPSAPPKVGITAEAMTMIGKRVVSETGSLRPGDTVTFEITATNPTATNTTVTMTDVLPDSMEFVSISPEADTVQFDSAGNQVRWIDHPLNARSAQTWELTVQLADVAVGAVTNVLTGTNVLPQTPRCEDDPEATCAVVSVLGGALNVTKTVSGEAAEFATATAFEFQVVCRLGDVVVADVPVTLRGAETSDTISAPLGSTCTVTETNSGGATTPAVERVVVLENEPAVVTVDMVNIFAAGYLAVEKTVSGVGAAPFGGGDYGFSVGCSFGSETVLSQTVTVTVDANSPTVRSDVFGPLPVGAECVVAEVDTGRADATPEPIELTVVEGLLDAPQLAEFENVFSAGTVEIVKEISGSGAAEHKGTEFVFLVTCQNDQFTEDVSQSLSITGAGSVAMLDSLGEPLLLPVGTRCFVAETESGGADEITVSHGSPEQAVTVVPGEQDAVQMLSMHVTNTFMANIPPGPVPPGPVPPAPVPPASGSTGSGTSSSAAQIARTGAPSAWLPASGGLVLLVLGAWVLVGRTRRV